MLRQAHERIRSENGFSLIELLAVSMIVGVLAAIALPAFIDQGEKGMDADAKSNVRNVVTSVESCFVETRSYASCDSQSELEAAGVKAGTSFTEPAAKEPGAVSVTATDTTYTVVAYSRAASAFEVAKDADGNLTHSW